MGRRGARVPLPDFHTWHRNSRLRLNGAIFRFFFRCPLPPKNFSADDLDRNAAIKYYVD